MQIRGPSSELLRALKAGQLPGATALELGCGTGTNAMELARNGYRVTAVDFVESAVNRAREKARRSGAKVDFVVGDLTAFDLGGPYGVVSDRGLYHAVRTINLPAFLKMLERVTRGGHPVTQLDRERERADERGSARGPRG